eukprot:277976_1
MNRQKIEIKQPQIVDDVIDTKENKNTDDENEQTLNELVTRRIINDCIQQQKETQKIFKWSDIQKQLNINDNDPDIDKYKSMYEDEKNKTRIVYNKSHELKDIIDENWYEKNDEAKDENKSECTITEISDDDFMKECKPFERMKDA